MALLAVETAMWLFAIGFVLFLFWRRRTGRSPLLMLRPLTASSRRDRASVLRDEPVEERRQAIAWLQDSGFDAYIDIIGIRGESPGFPSESLKVLSGQSPYVHYLVELARDGTDVVGINVYRNDAGRALVRALRNVEPVPEECRSSRGEYRRVYRGVAAHGERDGERQEWTFTYEP